MEGRAKALPTLSMADNGSYLKISQARWIIGILAGLFGLVLGWQALDLDRHEDQTAHPAAEVELAVAQEQRDALKADIDRRLKAIEDSQARTERILTRVQIKLGIDDRTSRNVFEE